MDEFASDLQKAQRVRNDLQNHLKERAKKLEMGETTGGVDSRLRGGLQELALELDNLIRQLHNAEQDPSRYKLTGKELDRRKKLIAELEADLNTIEEKSRVGTKLPSSGPAANFKRTAGENETSDTRNLSNSDMRNAQMQMYKQQSEIEDALVGTTENLVVVAKNIGDETDLQNQLLDEVDRNVDSTQSRMNRTTYRMKELIYKSNDCCLMICVVVLIGVLVALIVVL